MRLRNDLYDDFDDFDDFAFEKSQAFHRLLDEYRRDDRRSHRDHRHSNQKHRWDPLDRDWDWDWEEDDDWT